MSNYKDFILSKERIATIDGLTNPKLPKILKPFQRAATQWALARRKSALFAGTGLGKTLKQLSWSQAVSAAEDGPVIILTPLAVAQQTVAEADKFGIKGVGYASSPKKAKRITVTNYDRVENFDPADYCAVVLDESSIIKHDDSKTRQQLLDMFSQMAWKLCCTATPSPNDFVELGNHAEFLGVMSAAEMLATFFVHEGAIRATDSDEEWRLKRHAEHEFWQWVSTWALVYASPMDLGFKEKGYELPILRKHLIEVEVQRAPQRGHFFPDAKMTLGERIKTRAATVTQRAVAAADLINADEGRSSWLIWCARNDEAAEMERLVPGALQVSGSMSRELKAERLLGFTRGEPLTLVTKPSIAGFGMNWQHCHKMVFLGLNDSFEQLYQAIRRCWRFGQTEPVDVYLISSTAEYAVFKNLLNKEHKQERTYKAIADLSREAIQNPEVRVRSVLNVTNNKLEFPKWLNG